MSANPYEPPKSPSVDFPHGAEDQRDRERQRREARQAIRSGLLILLVPAIVNFGLFHLTMAIPRLTMLPIAIANGAGLLILGLGVWFVGLQILEFCTGGSFTVFAKRSNVDDWLSGLYQALRRVPKLAFCGAVVWALWLIGIHAVGISFVAMSVPVAIAGHLFAAAFYVPLVRNWYQAEKQSGVT